MKKRIIGILLAVLMIVSVIPFAAVPASAGDYDWRMKIKTNIGGYVIDAWAEEHYVWNDDHTVTLKAETIILTGWEYDVTFIVGWDVKNIYFDNMSIVIREGIDRDVFEFSGIHTIHLTGDNYITNECEGRSCIYSEHEYEIVGDGNLGISSKSTGIYANYGSSVSFKSTGKIDVSTDGVGVYAAGYGTATFGEETNEIFIRSNNDTYGAVYCYGTAGGGSGISLDPSLAVAGNASVVESESDVISPAAFDLSGANCIKVDGSVAKSVLISAPTERTVTNNTPETDKDTNHGYISVAQSANTGDTVAVTVVPDEGYALDSLKFNNGKDHDITKAKSFMMPPADVTVTATFRKHDLTVTKEGEPAVYGTDYVWVDDTLKILERGLTVSGETEKEIIESGVTVYFDDLSITVPEGVGADAVTFTSSGSLYLKGNNVIKNNNAGKSGICCDSSVFISGDGNLDVTCAGSGITSDGGIIINNSGKINVNAADIGLSVKLNLELSDTIDDIFIRGNNDTYGAIRIYETYRPAEKLITKGSAKAAGSASDVTGEAALSADNDCIMVGESVARSVHIYAPVYNVVNGTPESEKATNNGYIAVTESSASGRTVKVTVIPNEDYKLKSLKYNDGVDHDITSAKSFTMPAADVTVTAEFEISHDLTVTRDGKPAVEGTDYSWEERTLLIFEEGLTVSGTTERETVSTSATDLTIEDLSITVPAESKTNAIEILNDFVLYVKGDNVIINNDASYSGIYFVFADLFEIAGDGNLEINAAHDGIYVEGSAEISTSGKLTVKADHIGLRAENLDLKNTIGELFVTGGNEQYGAVYVLGYCSPDEEIIIKGSADTVDSASCVAETAKFNTSAHSVKVGDNVAKSVLVASKTNVVVSLGAKINEKTFSLRLGAKYNGYLLGADEIASVEDLGMIFYPSHLLGENVLDLDNANAARMSATAIEEFDERKTFADYETFTFYVTIVNIPEKGRDTNISFRPFIIYSEGTFYGKVLERSYNGVIDTLGARAE